MKLLYPVNPHRRSSAVEVAIEASGEVSLEAAADLAVNNCPEDHVLTDLSASEGVVYGSLPGSGGGSRSHSVADVMFGRLPR